MQKRKPDSLVPISSKKSRTTAPSAIEALPEELFLEVLSRVASSSHTDLFTSKLTSKSFLRASQQSYILRHVSLHKFTQIPWKSCPNFFSFLHRCEESGNPEALYRKGMTDFFSCRNRASGMANLRAAAEKEHTEASYVYGMILYLDSDSKEVGLGFLRGLEGKGRMRGCRRRIKGFVWKMWIRDVLEPGEGESGCQTGGECGLRLRESNRRRNRWEWKEEEEDDWNEEICETCKWNREARRFCKVVRGGRFCN